MSVISEFSCFLQTEEKLADFADNIASLCGVGDCVLLYGDVGAGKTTFARGFIRNISGVVGEIISPTFNLVQTYPLKDGGEVWHYDLYRLKNHEELLELGIDEAFFSGITIIEWPEIVASFLPKNSLSIKLEIEGDGRVISCFGDSDRWEDRFKKLKSWENR